ncbi:MAG: hypothetical protein N2C14_26760, partial [Planctomycetales bacterium]
ELRFDPTSRFELGESMAMSWWPVIGQAAGCDTVIIDADGFELITRPQRWPSLLIEVSGRHIDRPDVLIR